MVSSCPVSPSYLRGVCMFEPYGLCQAANLNNPPLRTVHPFNFTGGGHRHASTSATLWAGVPKTLARSPTLQG